MGNDNQDTVKNEVDVFYYSTHIGSNISIDYNRNFKNHSLIAGIKYHINPRIKPSAAMGDYAYYKKFYADNLARRLGITLGYEYHLKDINPFVSPYFFYNLQGSYMNVRRDWVNESAGQLTIEQYQSGPFFALENTTGAGLSIKLTGNLNLNQSAGIGAVILIDDGNPKTINTWQKNGNYNWTWEAMYLLRLGLTYKLQ